MTHTSQTWTFSTVPWGIPHIDIDGGRIVISVMAQNRIDIAEAHQIARRLLVMPELLEACKLLRQVAGDIQLDGNRTLPVDDLRAAFKVVDAAIAKVEPT